MYEPAFYKNLSLTKIREKIVEDGFDPIRIVDPPDRVYPPHRHAETKLLAFLEGEMDVTVQSGHYHCKPGDKLLVPQAASISGQRRLFSDARCRWMAFSHSADRIQR